jgi:WD40-like Beta Propeller Repeat
MKKIFIILVLASLYAYSFAQQNNKNTATPVSGTSMLYGKYSAPAGMSIILQNNATNDLSITAQKTADKNFSTTTFQFSASLLDKTKFKVTLKKLPVGQTGSIYSGAEGSMPQTSNTLRVGLDFTYDMVSRSSDDHNFSTFYETNDPAIGGINGEEGRYVTFVSTAVGIGGSKGKHRQIFWRDRNTGITKLISIGLNGDEGNGDSYAPSISGDGKSVAFESYSTNLIQNDKNGFRDIFIWQSETNKIERVSIGMGESEPNAESYEPSVSGDGKFVAFTSTASNLSNTEKGVSNNNVFLRDMQSNKTIMISIDPFAQRGGGGSNPSISSDGNRIAFYSHTNTLIANDTNGLWDIFLWEKNVSTLKRISLTSEGKERNQGNESANRIVAPAISGDGQFIAYSTTASNMTTVNTNNFQHVYVYDINKNVTSLASKNTAGVAGNSDSPIQQGEKIAISFDGKWVSFATKSSNLGVPEANVVIHNMLTNENKQVSSINGSSVGRASISHSGSYVIFGIGGKLDNRFPSSGIFANYTGLGPCRFCPE